MADESLSEEAKSRVEEIRNRQLISNFNLAWSDSFHQDGLDREITAKNLSLLNQALKHSPADPKLVERLGKMAGFFGAEEELLSVEATEKLLNEGTFPVLVRLIFGASALRVGNAGGARPHLDYAIKADSRCAILLGRLALQVASSNGNESGTQGERSRRIPLLLINEAVALQPRDSALEDLRGEILEKLNGESAMDP